MAEEWSGLASEVLLTLDRGRSVPLRAQLEDQFRQAIRSGRLRRRGAAAVVAGTGQRHSACPAAWSQECYAQLQAEGYLIARGRLGDPGRRRGHRGPRTAPAAAPAARRPRLAVDFASGVPDLASASRGQDWAWAVARSLPGRAERGVRLRRRRAAARGCARCSPPTCGRVRGAAADPASQVVICTGFAQGLGLVLRALAGHGRDPGGASRTPARRTEHHRRRGWAGLQAVPVPGRRLRRGRGRARRDRRGAVVAHPGPSVADRRGARPGAAARADRLGRRARRRRSSRTTTTPSSATTATRSAPCRDSRPTGWSPSAPSASPWPRPCGWAGSLCPPDLADTVTAPKGRTDRGSPGPRPARARPADRVRPLRPAPAADARRLRRPARRPRPGAGRSTPQRCGSPAWRPASTPSPTSPPGAAEHDVDPASPGTRSRAVRDEHLPRRPLPPPTTNWCSASATPASAPSRQASPSSATSWTTAGESPPSAR